MMDENKEIMEMILNPKACGICKESGHGYSVYCKMEDPCTACLKVFKLSLWILTNLGHIKDLQRDLREKTQP